MCEQTTDASPKLYRFRGFLEFKIFSTFENALNYGQSENNIDAFAIDALINGQWVEQETYQGCF